MFATVLLEGMCETRASSLKILEEIHASVALFPYDIDD